MILLQIYFEIADSDSADFERLYRQVYVPALQVQPGYLRSNLLHLFPADTAAEISAAPSHFNYQLELVFDTESNRRRWVDSAEHQRAWPMAEALAISVAHRGYDLVGEHFNNRLGEQQ